MLTPGMLSITFRNLSAEQVIQQVQQAQLPCIEWGGDVHAPHGKVDVAKTIARQCADAGLTLPSYGSYYRAAVSEGEGLSFEAVLDSAKALGVETIRVWANNKGTDRADDADWQATVDDLQRICTFAADEGMTISLEYHGGTLTDTFQTTRQLLDRVSHPALRSYWQPRTKELSTDEQAEQLSQLLPAVTHLHVFSWTFEDGVIRHPLAHNQTDWLQYLKVAQSDGQPRYAMMEFVKDNDPQQFLEDAATLKSWLATNA